MDSFVGAVIPFASSVYMQRFFQMERRSLTGYEDGGWKGKIHVPAVSRAFPEMCCVHANFGYVRHQIRKTFPCDSALV